MQSPTDKLMKEYYEREKDNYPNITFKQFKEICYAPWKYVRQEMASGDLPEIRLKYIGVFRVHIGRAKFMRDHNVKKYNEGSIPEDKYKGYQSMLNKFLKRVDNE